MKELFKIKGFMPYMLIVFINAMVDLGHKITLQNTIFKAYEGPELIILTAIVNALILLPFILLFSPSGYLSDKYPKPKVIQYASFIAILITTGILISYTFGWFWTAFAMTLLLAAQSAIYSPAKYGLIKELAGNEKVAQANALVQAVTIISILLGAVLFSIVFEFLLKDQTLNQNEILTYIYPIGFLLIAGSIFEFILSLKLPKTEPGNEELRFDLNKYKKMEYLKQNIKTLKSKEIVWLSVMGLSILWGLSQLVVAVFGPYLKETMGITDTVIAQGMLSLAGLGIVAGAVFSGRVSKNYIEIGTIPLGAFGVAASLLLIPLTDNLYAAGVLIFLYGFFSGIFIVPLNALIQFHTKKEHLGTVLAGNNFIQNIFMFGFLIFTSIAAYFSLSSEALIYVAAATAFAGFLYTLYKMPQSMVRFVVKSFITVKYNVSVYGLNNIDETKGKLLLGNHVSFLDWAILQIGYPEQIRFVMDKTIYNKWYLKPFFKFFEIIPISARGSKHALDEVSKTLSEGRTVAIFPEGMITRNGHLSEFQRGFEKAAQNAENIDIIPFYLRGLWEGPFSRASDKTKKKDERDVSITFGKPLPKTATAPEVKKAVFDLSIKSWKNYSKTLPSIQEAWIDQAKKTGDNLAIADSTGVEITGNKFITGTLLIAGQLKKHLKKDQNIGVLLPTSAAGSMGNMAVLSLGKTVVNINYSAGESSIRHALEIAETNKIVTSRQFLTKLGVKGFDLTEVLADKELIYLEDIKKEISPISSLIMFIVVKMTNSEGLKRTFIKKRDPAETAAILFSSGSEGTPKGIELTHRNIMGNIKQTAAVMNATEDDVILGTLPIFHSFGLTVTTLLPLIEGIPVACHPDPTDGFNIGKLAYKYKATILLGTATFFRLYVRNRKLHPLMFESIRLVVAGAEKLPEEIRKDFKAKFGKDIFEGYGATETTPVATININDVLRPDNFKPQIGNKPGTVGLPVPGSNIKIVDPETFNELPVGEEGMVLIGGTQIMKGYLKNTEKTKEAIKEIDGIRWYVTGDKGRVDTDGFLTLVDRYSRFAKIGGEMVSLGLIEGAISKMIGDEDEIMVTAIPDNKKGEKIVLFLAGTLEITELQKRIKESDLNPLFQPAVLHKIGELPKLGTGKADFKGLKKLAIEKDF